MATAVCRERGAKSTLVVPADIPLIDGSELQKIVDSAPPRGAVLVPDAAGRGTNAAWRSPGDLFPLRFGNDSFLPHLAAAKATGLPCVVLKLPGIARDVDRPEDLRELASASGERRSQKLVRSWNLEQPESGLAWRGRTRAVHRAIWNRQTDRWRSSHHPDRRQRRNPRRRIAERAVVGGGTEVWACAFRMATSWW